MINKKDHVESWSLLTFLSTCSYYIKSQYNQSKIYRDVFLKKRCVVKDAAARLLLHESLHEKLDGVSNVASDQGNLGVFYITNFRVIWHSILNERFSISLPYLQIDGVSLTKSKYGLALAIRTTQYAESMKIGFRIDSEERTKAVAKTIKMLWKVKIHAIVYIKTVLWYLFTSWLITRFTLNLQYTVLDSSLIIVLMLQ